MIKFLEFLYKFIYKITKSLFKFVNYLSGVYSFLFSYREKLIENKKKGGVDNGEA